MPVEISALVFYYSGVYTKMELGSLRYASMSLSVIIRSQNERGNSPSTSTHPYPLLA